MLFNFDYSTGGSIAEGDFSFAGKHEFLSDGSGNFELILYESGVLTWYTDPGDVDICLVAGGMPGEEESVLGGKGGEVVNVTNQHLTAGTYNATVGGSGEDSSLAAPGGASWTANSGEGAETGRPGRDGSLAWGDANTLLRPGVIYGSGGGYGSVLDYRGIVVDADLGGSVGTADDGKPNGHGGSEAHPVGYSGMDGTGQGGGGGRREWTVETHSSYTRSYYVNHGGGKGGSGAILIRNHKEVSA